MARPLGSRDRGIRARRGSKQLTPANLGAGIVTEAGSERIAAVIASGLEAFDDELDIRFLRIINRWQEKVFTPRLQSAVRATSWVRRGLLSSVETQLVDYREAAGGRTYVVGAKFPDDETAKQGVALERGRESGQPKGKYYLVPLASWVLKTGHAGKERKYMTSSEITRDLSRPGTFMPKQEFMTKAGPARIIFLMNRNRASRDTATGRFKKRARKTESKLAEIATAMYLALKGTTGIYGAANKDRKRPKRSMSPLAAQFGLTRSRNAPGWFAHGSARSLEILARSVNAVRGDADALNRALPSSAISEDAEGLSIAAWKHAMQEGAMSVEDQMLEMLDRAARGEEE